MKVVVAVDSFKGDLSSFEIGNCIKENILEIDENIDVEVFQITDGGKGTIDVLTPLFDGTVEKMIVHDAYGNLKESHYGLSKNKKVAIIEVNQIVGLNQMNNQNPLIASTYGVGEVIDYCMSIGVAHFIIGLDDTITNDGGLGMMQALGLTPKFTNNTFNILELESLSNEFLNPRLKECEFIIATEMQNALCKENGTTYAYGLYKNIKQEDLLKVDLALENYANLVNDIVDKDCKDEIGAGAAGGLGFAFMSFLDAKVKPAKKLVIQLCKLDEMIEDADLLITGESVIDRSTKEDKVTALVSKIAKQAQVPVVAIGESISKEAEQLHDLGLTACFSIQTEPLLLEEMMDQHVIKDKIAFCTRQIIRLFQSNHR